MSNIYVGTSSWADHSLVESGLFYPQEVKTPAARLSYYSERFPIAEIDSSYHYFPTRKNLNLWLDVEERQKSILLNRKNSRLIKRMTGEKIWNRWLTTRPSPISLYPRE